MNLTSICVLKYKTMKYMTIILSFACMSVLGTAGACMNIHSDATIKGLPPTDSLRGFAVVELFTSEGCSSCPPADRLIENIQKDNKDKDIYIMAFHVDYWDHQGWKDRFSSREFSNRQRRYADWLRLSSVYTPQVVINGATEYVGSDGNSIVNAISTGLTQSHPGTLTLTPKLTSGKLDVEYQVTGNNKNAELVLALVQRSASSDVRAGENEGKQLSHVQIVRQLQYVDANSKSPVTISLPMDFNKEGWELIGFVQRTTDGHIIAATKSDF